MNLWTGVGRLGKDNDLKYTSGGTAILNQSMAVRRNFKNKEKNEYESDWINIVLFGKTAENFVNYTQKGSRVAVEGRIQTRNYDNQQGQRVYITEVIVEQFHLLEPKQDSNQQQQQTNGYQQPQQQQSYNNNQNYNNFNMQDGTPVDISEDDLPF